jgi:type VI secretion system ImpA family protein
MIEKIKTWSIDLEELLSPISAERPAGEFLRYEDTYDRIKEARREDDPNLPQGIWQTELKKADWKAVNNICLEAITTRSKDLQLAAWLLEAWSHLHGFSGVKEGLKLIIDLCEEFWDTIYPKLDGTNVESRLAPIRWINEKLSIKLKQIPITQPQTGDTASYCWTDWENALHLENLAKNDVNILKAAEAEGKVTLAKFHESVMLSPKSFYVTLSQELIDVINATNELESFLDEKCGDNAPGLLQFKGALLEIQRMINNILKERQEEGDASVSVPEEYQDLQVGAQDILEVDSIRSRAEAYQILSEVADFLMRVEPHSPVPYLVKRAVSWGSMPLAELLQELVQNQSDLQALYALLGMKKGGDS